MKGWNSLSQYDKAEIMKLALENGVSRLDDIRQIYNEYAEGGDLGRKKGSVTWRKSAIKGSDKAVNEGLLDAFANAGLNVVVTSGARSAAQQSRFKTKGSRHLHGQAIDIVPGQGTTFEDIEYALHNDPGLYTFMLDNNLGYYDETPRTAEGRAHMAKTGASGPHFHFGRDTRLASSFADRMKGATRKVKSTVEESIGRPISPQYLEQPSVSFDPSVYTVPILSNLNEMKGLQQQLSQQREALNKQAWEMALQEKEEQEAQRRNDIMSIMGLNQGNNTANLLGMPSVNQTYPTVPLSLS